MGGGEKAVLTGCPIPPKMQLNDALIEIYRAEKRTLDNLLEGDRGLSEIGCNGESSILDS